MARRPTRRGESDSPGPHPVRRAIVGLLLGVALGALVALLRPRGHVSSPPPAGG